MALNNDGLREAEEYGQMVRAAESAPSEPDVNESTLALQIRAAVSARVAPFEVEIEEIQRGASLLVGVVGIKRVFGYRRFMADGSRNLHTPQSFADSVALEVQKDVVAMMAAQDKREAKAVKRMKGLK